MITYRISAYLFLTTALASCNTVPADITGKWFVVEYTDEQEQPINLLPGSYIEFREDGHLVFAINGYTQNGTWESVPKNNMLTMKPWHSPVIQTEYAVSQDQLQLYSKDSNHLGYIMLNRQAPTLE